MLFVPTIHLVGLLLLAALELVVLLLAAILAAKILPFLIVPLLELLTLGILVPLYLFALLLMFRVQPGIVGGVTRRTC